MMKFDNESNDINSRNYCFDCFNKWTSQRDGKIHVRRIIDFETFTSMIIIKMKYGTLEMKLLLIFKIRNFHNKFRLTSN